MIVRHRSPVAGAFGSALDRSFDRTFDQLTSSLFDPRPTSRRRVPDVEARWDDDTLVLDVDLPGVPAEAVSVEVAGRSLTLAAHTERLEWSRSLQLGTSLDPDKVSARHVDGRLTVRIGAVDAPAARTIEIVTTPAERQLDTGADGNDRNDGGNDQAIEASSSD